MRLVLLAILGMSGSGRLGAQVFLKDRFPHLTFNGPVGVCHPNDSTDRLCVVEQGGTIRIFPDDSTVTSAKVFLDISDSIVSGGEMGLLGLAFHPRYSSNGFIYVDYDRDNPLRTVISRFRVSATNPDSIDRSSELILLEQLQPFTNHKGGQLAFGPDGNLYIAFGDGGSGGDPFGNGQNTSTFLGKILRINVDSAANGLPYSIPPGNPFAGDTAKKQEIFAYGLRNPWRFSFDGGTLWCADVGQDLWEEIDTINPGKDYGWNIMEGFHCYNPSSGCDTTGLTMPIFEYHHDAGRCAIIGGFVYRGSAIPALNGQFVYGDYCTGEIWMLSPVPSAPPVSTFLIYGGINISAFGVDRHNELYVCDNSGGKIYKFWSYAPGQVSLVNPSDGAVNQTDVPFLSWNAVAGAGRYQLQVARDSLFGDLAVNDSTVQDTAIQVGPLTDSTLFYWRVRAVNGIGAGPYSAFRTFTTAGSSAHFAVLKYWNLLSLPYAVTDPRPAAIYPAATSGAFMYDPSSGYVVRDTLTTGAGFWLKFADNELIALNGTPVLTDTIGVTAGWNLVGSVSRPVPVSGISSLPGGLVTSQFFGYAGGYVESDTLQPGQGYWVKLTGAGELIISAFSGSGRASTGGKGTIRIVRTDDLPPAPPGSRNGLPDVELPSAYRLEQNFPNPFNPSTVIRYDLPREGFVTLKVYNLLGAVVATLVEGMESAGYKSAVWNPGGDRGISSGVYFYRLTAGSYSAMGKMLYLR
ncbi:MAG TPA: PQQ-dependent sugar dehydrogenase [Bacteroidota bacterium]|nr:PQQ-dependent sugar dehydrogenase [Bacteroidota bacterium]